MIEILLPKTSNSIDMSLTVRMLCKSFFCVSYHMETRDKDGIKRVMKLCGWKLAEKFRVLGSEAHIRKQFDFIFCCFCFFRFQINLKENQWLFMLLLVVIDLCFWMTLLYYIFEGQGCGTLIKIFLNKFL